MFMIEWERYAANRNLAGGVQKCLDKRLSRPVP